MKNLKKNGRNDDNKTVKYNVLKTYRSAAVCYIIEYSTHWLGSWVGLRIDLDALEWRKISYLCWELNH